MAYEKLSVVYQYRDDPNCAESDEESSSPDWWKDEGFLQKESQNEDNDKDNKKGLLTSNSQKHNYNKVDVNGSPEKPASDKDGLSVDDQDKPGQPDKPTVSERFKGALSNVSHNFGNWLLTSTRNSVPVDTFMCGGNAGVTADNLERTLCPPRVPETRKY